MTTQGAIKAAMEAAIRALDGNDADPVTPAQLTSIMGVLTEQVTTQAARDALAQTKAGKALERQARDEALRDRGRDDSGRNKITTGLPAAVGLAHQASTPATRLTTVAAVEAEVRVWSADGGGTASELGALLLSTVRAVLPAAMPNARALPKPGEQDLGAGRTEAIWLVEQSETDDALPGSAMAKAAKEVLSSFEARVAKIDLRDESDAAAERLVNLVDDIATAYPRGVSAFGAVQVLAFVVQHARGGARITQAISDWSTELNRALRNTTTEATEARAVLVLGRWAATLAFVGMAARRVAARSSDAAVTRMLSLRLRPPPAGDAMQFVAELERAFRTADPGAQRTPTALELLDRLEEQHKAALTLEIARHVGEWVASLPEGDQPPGLAERRRVWQQQPARATLLDMATVVSARQLAAFIHWARFHVAQRMSAKPAAELAAKPAAKPAAKQAPQDDTTRPPVVKQLSKPAAKQQVAKPAAPRAKGPLVTRPQQNFTPEQRGLLGLCHWCEQPGHNARDCEAKQAAQAAARAALAAITEQQQQQETVVQQPQPPQPKIKPPATSNPFAALGERPEND